MAYVYPNGAPTSMKRLDPRSQKCIFVAYTDSDSGTDNMWNFRDTSAKKLVQSKHAVCSQNKRVTNLGRAQPKYPNAEVEFYLPTSEDSEEHEEKLQAEQRVEQHIEQHVEQRVKQLVEHRVEQRVEQLVEQRVEQRVGQLVEQRVEQLDEQHADHNRQPFVPVDDNFVAEEFPQSTPQRPQQPPDPPVQPLQSKRRPRIVYSTADPDTPAMRTRSRSRVVSALSLADPTCVVSNLHVYVFDVTTPTTIHKAMASPQAREWGEAYQKEIHSFLQNDTSQIVELPDIAHEVS
jgi:hypothetical protein